MNTSDDASSTPARETSPDPTVRLSTAEVRAQAPDGWAQIMGRLKVRYRTADFAQGYALMQRIAEDAERWNHHPDVTLTYEDVVVSLVSHDVDGITSRDLRLAGLITEHARAMDLTPDVGGLTQLDPGLDTRDGSVVAPFYSALLAAPLRRGEPIDPSGQTPTVWWQEPSDDGDGLPPGDHDQRWHFDVWVAQDAAPARLQAVLDAGGRLVSDAHAPSFWVVEDADGNRHCICTPHGR